MKVTVKLFALLAKYLPPGAVDHTVQVDADEGASPHAVLAGFNVPPGECQLMLVNGRFVSPSQRDTYQLEDNDALAVWPPIAGGG